MKVTFQFNIYPLKCLFQTNLVMLILLTVEREEGAQGPMT